MREGSGGCSKVKNAGEDNDKHSHIRNPASKPVVCVRAQQTVAQGGHRVDDRDHDRMI